MNDLYGGECPYCRQHDIVRAVKLIAHYLCDDEFLDYCKRTALLEEDGEDVFEAVSRIQRFADGLEDNMRQEDLKEGMPGWMRAVRVGGHWTGED